MTERSVDVIEAEIAALKAAGKHHSSAEIRDLRAELKSLGAVTTESAPDATVPPVEVVPEKPAFASEAQFIDTALAGIAAQIEFSGSTSGLVKSIYNKLEAVIRVRRISLGIVARIGEGAEWPQFAALNLDPTWGRPVALKALPPEPVAAAPAPNVTDGGMPMRSKGPSKEAILARVTGGDPRKGIKQDISSRAEPERQAVTA
jgi:hypothetical protein